MKRSSLSPVWFCMMGLACWGASSFLTSCSARPDGSGDSSPPDSSTDGEPGDSDDGDDSGDDGTDPSDSGGSSSTQLPGPITGNELLVEGFSSELSDGSTRRGDERFTAAWSLTLLEGEVSQAFYNDELIDVIEGDLEGQAQLTYSASGSSFDPEFECPTSMYSGDVAWDASVSGSYEYIPALGTLSIREFAQPVSSPEYPSTFVTPGCPEQDSTSPFSYVWTGPGQGTWGFVSILLQDGKFEDRVENPSGNDLGQEDFYEITVEAGGPLENDRPVRR